MLLYHIWAKSQAKKPFGIGLFCRFALVWARGDSNSQPLRDQFLKLARIPIPPLALKHAVHYTLFNSVHKSSYSVNYKHAH